MHSSPQSSQLLPVLTFGRSVEVPLLQTQLPMSQRRRSHPGTCDVGTSCRIYAGMSPFPKATGLTSVLWLVVAESFVLFLSSAAIGLALSTLLLPAVSLRPGLGLDVMQVVDLAAGL